MNPAGPTPGSQASLREANRARVIDAVRRHGALTQVEVAGVSGLSPATVSNIVKELTQAGVLSTQWTVRSGRRATEVRLARTMGLVAGVDFGFRHLRVALADLSSVVVAEQHMPLPADHRADAGLDRAALLVEDLLASLGTDIHEVRAVGLGVPAPVNAATGMVAHTGVLPGWSGVPVAAILSARLGVPVHVDNDANLGALAEHRYGAAQGCRDAVYMRIAHGVGAGLILDGRVFHGHGGMAGEIGHVTIDENGPVCRCGNRGCLETYVRAPVLLELLRPSHGALVLREMVALAVEGDPGCRRVVADAGRHIGVALASVVNLLNPQRVVIGGDLARAGNLLLEPMRTAVVRSAISSAVDSLQVVRTALGERAEVLGAIALALDQVRLTVPGHRVTPARQTTGDPAGRADTPPTVGHFAFKT